MIPIFPCGSRRSKGLPSGTRDFLRLLIEELWTPKLVQIFAYGKWLYPYIMLLHGASDLDQRMQRCLKTRNSEDECTFPPNIFAPTQPPKSPQNLILGDLPMRNLLYREHSVSLVLKTVRSWIDYVVKQLVSRLAHRNIGLYATGVWAELHKKCNEVSVDLS